MELQPISQVAKNYGISANTLRYYEQIGLIKSIRKDDNAYRFYDEETVKQLYFIVLLRKLRISVKQIKDILNNQNAVEVINIFKQNIDELDEQITALSTVKSILARFVDELQKMADIHLKLDLLKDKTIISVVNALSFSENKINNIKEKVSMEMENISMNELNKAAEVLINARKNHVRVVFTPTETVAKMRCEGCDPPDETAKMIMERFIRDSDLFKIKPDFKVFSFGDGDGSWFLVTIPENIDVPAPFTKYLFDGGLWAVCTITPQLTGDIENVDEWEDNSCDYEWAAGRPRH